MHKECQAVFIDRDGVINDLIYRGEKYFVCGKNVPYTAPHELSEFRLKSRVCQSLRFLRDCGFLLALVTNQPDLAYGLMKKEEYDLIMQKTASLGFDDIFVCPHKRDDNCGCKKPKPGMLISAREKWGIDFGCSFLIGDTEPDMSAGKSVGCKTILISADYNRNVACDFRVPNLWEAALIANILKNRRGESR